MNRREELRPGLLGQLMGIDAEEAAVIIASLEETRALPGAVCEFGVAQGATTALIANEIRDEGTALHLFDSFEGLPAPGAHDVLLNDVLHLGGLEAYAGAMSCPENMVRERLRLVDFPECRTFIHVGYVDKTLGDVRALPALVRFAFVDLDFYQGTLEALSFLDGVAVPGAIVVVDDYGFFTTGARTAVEEWLRDAGRWQVREGDGWAVLRRGMASR